MGEKKRKPFEKETSQQGKQHIHPWYGLRNVRIRRVCLNIAMHFSLSLWFVVVVFTSHSFHFISFISALAVRFFLYPFQKVDFNSNGVAFVVVVANRRKALANETKNEHTIWWIKCAQQAGERGVSIDIPRVFYTNKIVFSCWYFFRFVSFHSMVFRLSSCFFFFSRLNSFFHLGTP